TALFVSLVALKVSVGTPASAASPQGAPMSSIGVAPRAQPQVASDWEIVDSPNAGAGVNVLQAVSAVGFDDVWAVGDSDTTYSGGHTIIQHWDGQTWSLVPSHNVGYGPNNLAGVVAV